MISKDSIEEKIYQRAVKKLYLDAVVIQQGRLVEQNLHIYNRIIVGTYIFETELHSIWPFIYYEWMEGPYQGSRVVGLSFMIYIFMEQF